MVRIDRLREDSEKRILRCSEGKSIWYQIWIDPGDMMRIEPLLEGGDRIWMEELEMYYLFFYEVRNGRRLIGKNKIKEILDIILSRDVFILWLLCVLCLGMPLTCVEIFVCSMFKAFLGMPLIRKPKNTRY